MNTLKDKLIAFVKKEVVLSIAIICTIITMFFVPIDKEYMAVSLESVNSNKLRLMEILADGKVDDSEIADLNKILDELEKISMTVEAIQLWCEKMKLLGSEK